MSARELRQILEYHVERVVGTRTRDVALLLSGGVDSQSVGLAAHHLGHRVHAYTFRLGSTHSSDSRWAERSARIMGWPWTPVDLPTSVRGLVSAWPRLYDDLQCRKKREFECAWPFLWVYPRIGQRFVLNGLNADPFFTLGRRAVRLGASGKNSDRGVFDELRRSLVERICREGQPSLSPAHNPGCMLQHITLQREYGLVDVDPYVTPEAYAFFMRYSWQELNIPRQKGFIRACYPQMADMGTRMHANYQGKASGISTHFEQLLATPINFNRRERTLDMFSDWWRPNREEERERVMRELRRRFPPR